MTFRLSEAWARWKSSVSVLPMALIMWNVVIWSPRWWYCSKENKLRRAKHFSLASIQSSATILVAKFGAPWRALLSLCRQSDHIWTRYWKWGLTNTVNNGIESWEKSVQRIFGRRITPEWPDSLSHLPEVMRTPQFRCHALTAFVGWPSEDQ